jgi:hypothetical protein
MTKAFAIQENKNIPAKDDLSQKESNKEVVSGFVDNRPEALVQRRIQQFVKNNLPAQNVIQRIKMKLNEAFPAVTDPIATGSSVFTDSGKQSISVKIPALDEDDEDEVLPLFVGQDYLNTDLSKSYKANKSNIAGGKPEILWNTQDNYVSIKEGHHRTIWSFYHGEEIDFQEAGLASKKFVGSMKYADAPQAQAIQE